jgi:hypothetical protein
MPSMTTADCRRRRRLRRGRSQRHQRAGTPRSGRPRILRVQLREHLLDQPQVTLGRIRACLVTHHDRVGHRDHLPPIQSGEVAETHRESRAVPAPGCSPGTRAGWNRGSRKTVAWQVLRPCGQRTGFAPLLQGGPGLGRLPGTALRSEPAVRLVRQRHVGAATAAPSRWTLRTSPAGTRQRREPRTNGGALVAGAGHSTCAAEARPGDRGPHATHIVATVRADHCPAGSKSRTVTQRHSGQSEPVALTADMRRGGVLQPASAVYAEQSLCSGRCWLGSAVGHHAVVTVPGRAGGGRGPVPALEVDQG